MANEPALPTSSWALDDERSVERWLAGLWGARVAVTRRRVGCSQLALARACAVTQQTISKVERGEMLPGDRLKLALADALDIRPADLFAWPTRPPARAAEPIDAWARPAPP